MLAREGHSRGAIRRSNPGHKCRNPAFMHDAPTGRVRCAIHATTKRALFTRGVASILCGRSQCSTTCAGRPPPKPPTYPLPRPTRTARLNLPTRLPTPTRTYAPTTHSAYPTYYYRLLTYYTARRYQLQIRYTAVFSFLGLSFCFICLSSVAN